VTVGWKRVRLTDGTVAEVRICYVTAWGDPEWREKNGLPPKRQKGHEPKEKK
jgi:hypothetical protein